MSAHTNSFLKAIETFEYHPSILKIKEFTTEKRMSFSFGYATQEKTYKTLQNLSKKKTCHENEIPVKIWYQKLLSRQYLSRFLQDFLKVFVIYFSETINTT